MSNLNYIVYPGNKTLFLPIILNLVNSVKNSVTTFIEPFAGSGTVSLAVSHLFHHIILNDIDYHVFKIHDAFKHGSYEELNEVIEEVWSFGNPMQIKEDYYAARTALNEKYHRTNTGNKEGMYYWAISSFAINSLMRFGPNGFNQGWGFRGIGRTAATRNMNEQRFNEIHNAYKDIKLFNQDYLEWLPSYVNHETMLFMDPPYLDKESGTYTILGTEYEKFLNLIKEWPGPVIYTDVFSMEKLEKLGANWSHKILRQSMGSGKPGKNNQKISEAVYFNFKEKNSNVVLF